MRTAVILVATILCGIGHTSDVVAAPRDSVSQAERSSVQQDVAGRDIQVGDMLQATQDVSLDSAVIAQGSKISVSAKKSANGRVILDVALADGHVVKGVPLAEIKKSFRRVAS